MTPLMKQGKGNMMVNDDYYYHKRWGTNPRTDQMGTRLVDFTITMRHQDLDRLNALAKEERTTISHLIRKSIWAYLDGK